MKPAPFEYYAPNTIEEALSLLNQHADDAKVLAGGQSLVPTMNFRLAQPAVLIDLNRIPDLFGIEDTGSTVRIRAMTRQASVEKSDVVRQKLPLIHETMPHIAHIQIRNRGTFGGSLAHADPAAELPAVAIARRARFRVQKDSGERWVEADDYYVGLFATSMDLDEMLTEVEFPQLSERSGTAFGEVARRHGDYAIVGCSAAVTLNQNGTVDDARIVYLGIGEGPVRAVEAEEILRGETPTGEVITEAAEIASTRDVDPPADIHATTAYRRFLAKSLFQQVVHRAVSKTQ